MHAIAEQAKEAYGTFKLRRASQLIMELSQLGNIYFEKKKPWQDAKDPARHQAMNTTISCCLEALRVLALISYPIMPETATNVWKMLGNGELDFNATLPVNQTLGQPKILFQKIEDEQIEQELKKLETSAQIAEEKKELPPLKEAVDIGDVQKIDLRVGTILSAEPVPKSKKLLKLEVDLGFEKRTIVSGISLHYTPEQLIGKKVIVVANLKSAKLMGVDSHGMILAGSSDHKLEVLTVDGLTNGNIVFLILILFVAMLIS